MSHCFYYTHPYSLHLEPFFERKMPEKNQKHDGKSRCNNTFTTRSIYTTRTASLAMLGRGDRNLIFGFSSAKNWVNITGTIMGTIKGGVSGGRKLRGKTTGKLWVTEQKHAMVYAISLGKLMPYSIEASAPAKDKRSIQWIFALFPRGFSV